MNDPEKNGVVSGWRSQQISEWLMILNEYFKSIQNAFRPLQRFPSFFLSHPPKRIVERGRGREAWMDRWKSIIQEVKKDINGNSKISAISDFFSFRLMEVSAKESNLENISAQSMLSADVGVNE